MKEYELLLKDENATLDFAKTLALSLSYPLKIYFIGDIGFGKTTLIRALFRELGVVGTIKSPTYTLIESYSVFDKQLCHCDFYRLNSFEEADFLGLNELFFECDLICVEWPEKLQGKLPVCDIEIIFTYLKKGRKIRVNAKTAKGEKVIAFFNEGKNA